MKYISVLNYYTGRNSQWKMFLEIDVPNKIAEPLKKFLCHDKSRLAIGS